MWMRLPNGREERVLNPHHIERFLREGGVEIPDPHEVAAAALEETTGEQAKVQALEAEIARLKEQVALLESQSQPQNQEQTDGTNEHGGADNAGQNKNSGPGRRKPAVQ